MTQFNHRTKSFPSFLTFPSRIYLTPSSLPISFGDLFLSAIARVEAPKAAGDSDATEGEPDLCAGGEEDAEMDLRCQPCDPLGTGPGEPLVLGPTPSVGRPPPNPATVYAGSGEPAPQSQREL